MARAIRIKRIVKQYLPGTIESILEDRLYDLLYAGTIDEDMFVTMVVNDIKQDLPILYDSYESMVGGRRTR